MYYLSSTFFEVNFMSKLTDFLKKERKMREEDLPIVELLKLKKKQREGRANESNKNSANK